jgi:hypothetical protein
VNLFCHLPCNWFSNRTLNALTAANTAPNVYTRNHICADISQSMRAAMIGEKVAELVKSLKLSAYWEQSVRRPTQSLDDGPNPETERKEIHNTIRLIRENYERGLYSRGVYLPAESQCAEGETGPLEHNTGDDHRTRRQDFTRRASKPGMGNQ